MNPTWIWAGVLGLVLTGTAVALLTTAERRRRAGALIRAPVFICALTLIFLTWSSDKQIAARAARSEAQRNQELADLRAANTRATAEHARLSSESAYLAKTVQQQNDELQQL